MLGATADKITASAGAPGTVNVLANDQGYAGSTLSVSSFTQGAKGTVTSDGAGNLTYTTTATIAGTDTFTYSLSDGLGNGTTGVVYVTIQGLDVYYRMSEGTGFSTADATGNGYTGTITNATWSPSGIGDTASLSFNGSSTLVTVPALNLNSNTVTMSGWVKSNSTSQPAYAGVIFNRDGVNGNGIDILNGNTLGYTWGSAAGTSNYNSGLTFTTGVWTFIALVITPTNATLYFQPQGGSLVTKVNTLSNLAEPFTGVTQIGQDAYATARTYNGLIDEVHIYNKSLGLADIQLLAAGAAPTIVNVAMANPNPVVTGVTTSLTVLGTDAGGESTLTYTWTSTSNPTTLTQPTFSVNGTNGAKNSVATFHQSGTFTFTVTIKNSFNATVTSSVTVVVNQSLVGITVSPTGNTIVGGSTLQFTASGTDQFASRWFL